MDIEKHNSGDGETYTLPYGAFGFSYVVPQNLLFYLDTYTYFFPVSGVGRSKEAEPRVFNLFSDEHFIDYVKAMVRYREKGYTTQLNTFDIIKSMGNGRKDLKIVTEDRTIIHSDSEKYILYYPSSIKTTSL